MEASLEQITLTAPLSKKELAQYSSLALAYIGDCVFELFVRTRIVAEGNDKANHYHKQTIQYVNAAAQTKMAARIKPLLSEEERAVFRRGKNAKSASPAKNQSLHDYHQATGFEALVGYLYLSGQFARLSILVEEGLLALDSENLSNRKKENNHGI